MPEKPSPEIEEYLEAMYRFEEKGEVARTSELARVLNVSQPSVTEMCRKLAARGFIEYKPRKGVKLTARGREIGKNIVKKHRFIERFLEMIGVRKEKVHGEACKLEHVVSDEVEKAIGEKIEPTGEKVGLDEVGIGKDARLVECRLEDKRTCERIAALGFVPGAKIRLLEKLGNGPIIMVVKGSEVALGREICSKILVKKMRWGKVGRRLGRRMRFRRRMRLKRRMR